MRALRRLLTGILVAVLALVAAVAASIPLDGVLNRGRTATLANLALPVEAGREVLAYVAAPRGAPPRERLPAVIMIHEFWGLKEEILGKADALAEQGFLVVAPDTFRGRSTSWLPKAIWQVVSTSREQVNSDLDAVFSYLAGRPDVDPQRILVMGFCYGGGASLAYSLHNPELAGTGIFYGSLVTDPERLRALPGPVLGIFGEDDPSIPVAEVEAFEAALEAAGVPHRIRLFPDKGHAFVQSMEAIRSDPVQRQAWEELLVFLDDLLRPPG